jgi:hypothetical protein
VQTKVSHDRSEETSEAKARWYQALPLAERMDIFCAVTDLALELNPHLPEHKHAQSSQGRIRILSAA